MTVIKLIRYNTLMANRAVKFAALRLTIQSKFRKKSCYKHSFTQIFPASSYSFLKRSPRQRHNQTYAVKVSERLQRFWKPTAIGHPRRGYAYPLLNEIPSTTRHPTPLHQFSSSLGKAFRFPTDDVGIYHPWSTRYWRYAERGLAGCELQRPFT